MKVRLNTIGFSDVKHIRVGEGFVILGIVLSAIGILTITHSQEWVCAVNERQLRAFASIYDSFKA